MPPKKQDKGQVKAEAKAKQKIVEDKTFGLKNKNKSKSVQKYIKSVQAQVTGGRVKTEHELKAEQKEKVEERRKQKQQAALLASLQKAQEALKGAAKTDNKAIGEAQKLDIYSDPRANKQTDDMDDWDQAKLEQVVKTKHGGQKCQSDIVCKHFLDALEKRLYGWFWQCPNGESCHYKHALPPGYVLKRRLDPNENADDLDEAEPLEEILERERQALPPGGTPVTFETFMAWKKKKEEEEKKAKEDAKKKREKESGRQEMSGRALFTFNPALFAGQGDDGSEDEDDEFARMLAEKKANEEQQERDAQAQAAANLAAAQEAEGVMVTENTAATTSASSAQVRNAAVFKMTSDVVNPDDLDD